MKKNVLLAGVLGSTLLLGTTICNAENWIKNNVDVPNKNVEANFYDADSVKVKNKTLTWTEKFILTGFGTKNYTKHLLIYHVCQQNILKKGDVTHHQIDFEIKGGKFRLIAKRNYTKDNELVCTDKDMGTEFDKSWHDIEYGSPMYSRHYDFVTKYKLGDI
jgi:hypothetical protein